MLFKMYISESTKLFPPNIDGVLLYYYKVNGLQVCVCNISFVNIFCDLISLSEAIGDFGRSKGRP